MPLPRRRSQETAAPGALSQRPRDGYGSRGDMGWMRTANPLVANVTPVHVLLKVTGALPDILNTRCKAAFVHLCHLNGGSGLEACDLGDATHHKPHSAG